MDYGQWRRDHPGSIDESKEKTFEDFTITDPEKRTEIFREADHLSNCGRDYVDKLKSAGVEVILEDFTKRMTRRERFRYGLMLKYLHSKKM